MHFLPLTSAITRQIVERADAPCGHPSQALRLQRGTATKEWLAPRKQASDAVSIERLPIVRLHSDTGRLVSPTAYMGGTAVRGTMREYLE